MYLVKTPQFVQSLFPNQIWKIPSSQKRVFLTFDDGPIPNVTHWVLEQLNQYNAKATFFCVGDNISKYPSIFEELKNEEHAIGNHTFHHLNGWFTENKEYLLDVKKGAVISKSNLFRPPYGKLKPSQSMFIQRHFNIIMWDILSGDFDTKITKQQCLDNVLQNISNGSIIVFHDSLKTIEKLEYVLPVVLKELYNQGYSMEAISPDLQNSFSTKGRKYFEHAPV